MSNYSKSRFNSVKDPRGPFDTVLEKVPCMNADKRTWIAKSRKLKLKRNEWVRHVLNGDIEPITNTWIN